MAVRYSDVMTYRSDGCQFADTTHVIEKFGTCQSYKKGNSFHGRDDCGPFFSLLLILTTVT